MAATDNSEMSGGNVSDHDSSREWLCRGLCEQRIERAKGVGWSIELCSLLQARIHANCARPGLA